MGLEWEYWMQESIWQDPEELLHVYLDSNRSRSKRFADTGQVAQLVGMSQRSVQLWIEMGLIQAVRIGKKYKVDMNSVMHYLVERSKL